MSAIYIWIFDSSSGKASYETLLHRGGDLKISYTCNCPGWTRRVAEDGSRSCKHTRAAYLWMISPFRPVEILKSAGVTYHGPIGDAVTAGLAVSDIVSEPIKTEEPEPFGRKFNL